MSGDSSFTDLVRRVRAGEEAAAAELVRRYEPHLHRVARIQLRNNPRLRRALDSVDICQSVLQSFFVRAASGQYDLDTPEQLQRLLEVMARNKMATHARHREVARREEYRPEEGGTGECDLVAGDASPSAQVARRDLVQAVRERLSADERWLVDQRGQGRPWAEIAAERGGSADALKKQFARALDRVARQLGLDNFADD
jgi:RNA polymerase sigma-70 factor (ECF subfamily)